MSIKTTVVSIPVRDADITLAFYKNVFGLPDLQIDERMITLELPNLSLFLMEKDAFETYSRKVGRGAQFPNGNAGMVISCAMDSKEAIDTILENVLNYGGAVPINAAIDERYGGYTGYFSDPDDHLWELVYPKQQA